jgi:hypothetical protein
MARFAALWQDGTMKPRRPAVKDSLQGASRDRHKRKKRAKTADEAARKGARTQGATDNAWPFSPIEIRGEPLSTTILRERRQ